jgi:predicted TPR repeat methyltransferase
MAAGDPDAAVRAFRRATELAPDQATPWTQLAALAEARDDVEAAEAAYRAALERDPCHAGALNGLATLTRRSGRLDEAAAVYDRLLASSPGDETALHLRAAVRDENPPTAPRGYAASLFDDHAGRYDEHMVENLGYRAPALMAEAIADRDAAVALDLGCGTGLVGAAIRARVGELHGVDLSRGMIEEARRKQLYDRLEVGDAVEALEAAAEPRFDLITAGDVLIYVGALDRLFAAAARRLAPGGRFAFTIELGPDDEPGYRLRPTGRYVHGRAYVERLAAAHHLAVERCVAAALRRELDADVDGLVVVLRSRSRST